MRIFRKSPGALIRALINNRQLLCDLAWRETVSRYKGSYFGLLWSLLTPLLMLCVYTFIFSEVFKSRWPNLDEASKGAFALILFSGLIIFNFFSECIGRSPGIVTSNANFVKKVIFPLEILPVTIVLSTLFQALVSVIILFIFEFVILGSIPETAILLPVVMLPVIFLTVGLSWFFAAVGVYLRDLGQTIGIVLTGLLFMSPIFFPITSFPEQWRGVALFNPLAMPIEQMRNVLIFSKGIDAGYFVYYMPISLGVLLVGFVVFQSLRKGFPDVL